MYDSFYAMDDASAEMFRCADGHPLRDREMQTKDLHCNLDHYYVLGSQLYRLKAPGTWFEDSAPKQELSVVDAGLLITSRSLAGRDNYSGDVCLYTHCYACLPVCYDDGALAFNGSLNDRAPSVRWTATFVEGRLTGVEQVECETREQIRQALLKEGLNVLPDDDRVVKKHFALLRDRDHKYRQR